MGRMRGISRIGAEEDAPVIIIIPIFVPNGA